MTMNETNLDAKGETVKKALYPPLGGVVCLL